jgi:hypothetical protein
MGITPLFLTHKDDNITISISQALHVFESFEVFVNDGVPDLYNEVESDVTCAVYVGASVFVIPYVDVVVSTVRAVLTIVMDGDGLNEVYNSVV